MILLLFSSFMKDDKTITNLNTIDKNNMIKSKYIHQVFIEYLVNVGLCFKNLGFSSTEKVPDFMVLIHQ